MQYSAPRYAATADPLVAHQRFALFAVYGTLGWSVLEEVRHRPGHSFVSLLAFTWALLHWSTLDARACGKTFCHGWAIPFVATCPAGVAAHLVWTRGWRRGLRSFATAMAAGAVVGVVDALVVYLL